jgi:hypothetical protein
MTNILALTCYGPGCPTFDSNYPIHTQWWIQLGEVTANMSSLILVISLALFIIAIYTSFTGFRAGKSDVNRKRARLIIWLCAIGIFVLLAAICIANLLFANTALEG